MVGSITPGTVLGLSCRSVMRREVDTDLDACHQPFLAAGAPRAIRCFSCQLHHLHQAWQISPSLEIGLYVVLWMIRDQSQLSLVRLKSRAGGAPQPHLKRAQPVSPTISRLSQISKEKHGFALCNPSVPGVVASLVLAWHTG
jgi:hypothetical protein